MNIRKLRTNHLDVPIGYAFNPLTLSWITESTAIEQTSARVTISTESDFSEVIYDSGEGNLDSVAFYPDTLLKPRTKYYWQVDVKTDDGECGIERSYFETGKMDEAWQGDWISAPFEEAPLMIKDFYIEDVTEAKVYVAALGVYELYCNGEKVSDELLAPGFHCYDHWIQTYTYDLTPYLKQGDNTIGFMIGDGWYKGPLGWSGIEAKPYGDEVSVMAEVHITLADGSEQCILTDESWLCHKSPVIKSNIYYGEDYDARLEIEDWCKPTGNRDAFTSVKLLTCIPKVDISDRMNPSIIKHECFTPEIIHTSKGETVLDFGQNHTGWVEGEITLPEGSHMKISYGELLQDGCFYRENMRTAEAQYTYISNGKRSLIRPHHTFYGYRYVKVEGNILEKDLKGFRAYAIYSDLENIGEIRTSNAKVNKLISNALWGQKSNFLDLPTDCPQRDERVGWTGDTQAFSGTASYNMDTTVFYNKYMKDLMYEQEGLNGGIPFIIPWLKTDNQKAILYKHSSCAWGDVATIVPWTVYSFFGDKALLGKHYPAMKAWVEYIKGQDDRDGGSRLWKTGFHFADWLALDNYKNPESPFGGTDDYYVASAYYAYSTMLVAKAAKTLGYEQDYSRYRLLLNEIKEAIVKEYFSPNGRCVTDTQTAKIIALHMDLVPETYKPRIIKALENQLNENNTYLATGFVGTTYLCSVLSENGLNDMAYTLLLNENMPSWLYEVNMGATTIWERWDSVMPDGKVNPKGMNSMNHYTYGSVVEWMYRYMCGLNPSEDESGFRKSIIRPMPDARISSAKCSYDSPMGLYKSGWYIDGDKVHYDITIPFGAKAKVILHGLEEQVIASGNYTFTGPVPKSIKRKEYVDEKEGI